ncbi:MAG TPA: hypothetical protein VN672_04420 [Solirubrobacteraceae bacterium]|nr:hypothetical protein [Solirubrobacteraceae bacterium]
MTRRADSLIRDSLDSTIRSLAIGSGTLQERIRAASGVLLDQLAPADFTHEEEHNLFCEIRGALAPIESRPASSGTAATVAALTDAVAERLASDVVDLRDMYTGRAIREAPERGSQLGAGRRGAGFPRRRRGEG